MRAPPIIGTIIVILGMSILRPWEIRAADAVQRPLQPVAALVERILPGHGGDFVMERIPAAGGQDVFEIESRDGKIVLRGNSPLSAAVGLNWYLKYYCHCSVSLNGNQLNLPSPLPAVARKVRQTAWAQSRYIFNYCTFGYSMPWWDWAQWEKFIDWMALQGINMPLAVTGQEAVWQAVGRRFGMTDSEIDAFLPGPPYLPFCWMGCLDGHGGPLPKDWIPRHVALERQILARERELGMKPVLQGYTGHIPEALVKKFPGTKAQRIDWQEFKTWMLDPTDPLFQKLGTAFIEEQTRLFGADHLYAADSFIEMIPPSGDLAYLANTGRAIYEGMAQADPKAVWLLQSWPFSSETFWTRERLKALLGAVPNNHILVLDLYCENTPLWRRREGFFGKPWVWCFIYNFGNRTILGSSGPLERFNDLAAARQDPLGQKVNGVGLMMEGFGHNSLIFDLMYEMAWREQVELKSWVREYARFRYGKSNADAQAAWEALRATIYHHGIDGYSIVGGPGGIRYSATALARTYRLLLQAQRDLGQSATYRHDLVNVARQSLSNLGGELYQKTMAAYDAKDPAAYRQASGEFLQLIRDLDGLLGTSDQFLLGSWLADAKRWGATDTERAQLEWNARRVITLWGTGPMLRDYAWKEWSGLLTGFYAKRWEIIFQRHQEALEAGRPFDQKSCRAEVYRFENEWAGRHEPYPSRPEGDSIEAAQRLFDKYIAGIQLQAPENLTTGKPATCSSSLPGMEASLANDGNLDTDSYWGADTAKDKAPWWQVDFEKPAKVGRVVLVCYYGDNRHYGFTVEGSSDGKEWTMLADRRSNAAPSTRDGYECKFAPREVRYLRVTQTSNSANTGRHLVEVMAFEK